MVKLPGKSGNTMSKVFRWSDQRVLITGHSGFKGSWLSILLKQLDASIAGFSRGLFSSSNILKDFHIRSKFLDLEVLADIRSEQPLYDLINTFMPTIVFHLAAQPLVAESFISPIETWDINTRGTLNLLNQLYHANSNALVIIVTTDKVYHNEEWIHGYRETDKLGGNDLYSASKASAELAVSAWSSSFLTQGTNSNLRVATARAGNVIGGGDWSHNRLIPDIMRSFQARTPLLLRNPASTRPWQHVLDCLNGYLHLAEFMATQSSWQHESYNFGPDCRSNIMVEDVVKLVKQNLPDIHYSLSPSPNYKESHLLFVNSNKAFYHFNWSPKFSVKEAVVSTVRWYSDYLTLDKQPFELCLRDIQYFIAE